jgi:RNA polymerase sigma-70 factor (ECF subfamily)
MPEEVERTVARFSAPDPVFAALVLRARAGCSEAARELFERYSGYLKRVVRQYLHRRLRPLYDSMDFVQCVWASFLQAECPTAFACPDALAAYLGRLAANKVIEVHRQRLGTTRKGRNREEQHDDLDEFVSPPRRSPTPSQVLIAEEHWERLKQGQPPAVCEVLELLRQGHSHREVAERTRLHPKMIQRLLLKLQKRLGLA